MYRERTILVNVVIAFLIFLILTWLVLFTFRPQFIMMRPNTNNTDIISNITNIAPTICNIDPGKLLGISIAIAFGLSAITYVFILMFVY